MAAIHLFALVELAREAVPLILWFEGREILRLVLGQAEPAAHS